MHMIVVMIWNVWMCGWRYSVREVWRCYFDLMDSPEAEGDVDVFLSRFGKCTSMYCVTLVLVALSYVH